MSQEESWAYKQPSTFPSPLGGIPGYTAIHADELKGDGLKTTKGIYFRTSLFPHWES